MSEGLKFDSGKQPYYAMPLEVLQPLADVFAAGEKKYATFNCLQPFKDADRRFYDGQMRHTEQCQLDPLAKDEETGCYHAAQVAFNTLMRLYHAKKMQGLQVELDREEQASRELAEAARELRIVLMRDAAEQLLAEIEAELGGRDGEQ